MTFFETISLSGAVFKRDALVCLWLWQFRNLGWQWKKCVVRSPSLERILSTFFPIFPFIRIRRSFLFFFRFCVWARLALIGEQKFSVLPSNFSRVATSLQNSLKLRVGTVIAEYNELYVIAWQCLWQPWQPKNTRISSKVDVSISDPSQTNYLVYFKACEPLLTLNKVQFVTYLLRVGV